MTETLGGINCVSIKNEKMELLIAQDFGPRILSLKTPTSPNLLAELPDMKLETAYGSYHFRGGHRLWHAPEHPERSYLPDNTPPIITPVENGLLLIQPVEAQTLIQKTMQIKVTADSVKIDHILTNHGMWAVETAPWAITMMAPGGTAVFPETSRQNDDTGLLPNRHIVLWPYSRLSDPRIHFDKHLITVKADPQNTEVVKFGYANTVGWQAYYREDLRTWFIKVHEHLPNKTYPDMGCSTECYCCHRFIELESLGPMAKLEPGKSVTHTEIWYIWENMDFEDFAGVK
jgi:hypothetical protein